MDDLLGAVTNPHPAMSMRIQGDDQSRPYPPHRFVHAQTVWHYTDAAGALGILTSKSFWATSASMLNDASELRYGERHIVEAYNKWSGKGGASEAHSSLRNCVHDLKRVLHTRPPFVLSASKSERLLNQWMNYSNTAGYAIGFYTQPLTVSGFDTKVADEQIALTPLWVDVVYGDDRRDEYILSIFEGVTDPHGGIARAFELGHNGSRLVRDNLRILAATLKDDAFAAEEEVRFIARPPASLVKYRPTARGITPYVELVPAASDSPEYRYKTANTGDPTDRKPLPVTKIIVGPPEGSAQRRIDALLGLRDQIGPPFEVESANIPYLP